MIAPVQNHAETMAFLGELSRRAKGELRPQPGGVGRTLRLMKNSRTGELKAAYDAAQTTEANKHYWKNADLLSADAANSPGVRQTLRSRSRYECLEANPFARGIVRTLAADTIGRGPQLQLKLNNRDARNTVEANFAQWAKQIRLAKKLRTARKNKAVDGEVFIRLVTNRRLRGPVKLDIEVIEADRVTNPLGIVDETQNVDGVVLDVDGNIVGYQVLKSHPGGNSFLSLETEFVPADQMIHLFNQDRAGQHRGIPEFTTALPLFILWRDYEMAVVQNARTVAKHTVLMKTASGAMFDDGEVQESFDTSVDPFDVVDIDYDMMTSLPFGFEPVQLKGEQPSTTFEMFRRAIWGEIARCADMPYNIAAGDSSKHNYASGQLDHLPYDFAIDVERSDWEVDCLDLLLEAWFDEAAMVGQIPSGVGSHEELPHEWFWPNRGKADRAKEANAEATELRSGTNNRRRILKTRNIDIDAHDEEAAESFGMTVKEYRRWVAASLFNMQPHLESDEDEEETEDDESEETEEETAAAAA